ncbi:MAG: hypothetical protein OXG56_08210 [Gammaproteobacteria bacterium]|nr:hypothetical protein [Gammaproteobacteria bacterium]
MNADRLTRVVSSGRAGCLDPRFRSIGRQPENGFHHGLHGATPSLQATNAFYSHGPRDATFGREWGRKGQKCRLPRFSVL